jgi:hypothetical protein
MTEMTSITTKQMASILLKNESFSQRAAQNLVTLNTASVLLYSLIAMVFTILIVLTITVIAINRKSKQTPEPENKYTSFMNLRKSKDSGQYRYLKYII